MRHQRGEVEVRPGGQSSISELRDLIYLGELSSTELSIAADYYGINGYPTSLAGAGGDALVGRVATPAEGRRPKPASRSTVAALLKSATEKIEAAIQLPDDFVMPTGPEPDPMTREWVRSPPVLGRKLSATELAALCLAAYESSFDLVCRSRHAGQLQEALRRWAEINAGIGASTSPLAKQRLEPERRNAAHAMLAIVLWDIVHDEHELAAALRGDPAVAWSGIELMASGGRVASHPTWGVMTSDLDADEFVLLAGEVMERRDDDGRASDLIIDAVRSGQTAELFDADTADTVLWAIGYGLASVGSWKLIELARWFHRHHRRSATTISLMAWSAHVASLHQHDGLAWRLTSACERLMQPMQSLTDAKRSGVRWQLDLIRSGCRVREADRFRQHKRWMDASHAVNDAVRLLRHAEQHAIDFDGSSALSKRIGNYLRRAEIFWVTHLMRHDGHPAQGFTDELERFNAVMQHIDSALTAANDADFDEGDLAIFRERFELLRAAHLDSERDFLDDPPTDSPAP